MSWDSNFVGFAMHGSIKYLACIFILALLLLLKVFPRVQLFSRFFGEKSVTDIDLDSLAAMGNQAHRNGDSFLEYIPVVSRRILGEDISRGPGDERFTRSVLVINECLEVLVKGMSGPVAPKAAFFRMKNWTALVPQFSVLLTHLEKDDPTSKLYTTYFNLLLETFRSLTEAALDADHIGKLKTRPGHLSLMTRLWLSSLKYHPHLVQRLAEPFLEISMLDNSEGETYPEYHHALTLVEDAADICIQHITRQGLQAPRIAFDELAVSIMLVAIAGMNQDYPKLPVNPSAQIRRRFMAKGSIPTLAALLVRLGTYDEDNETPASMVMEVMFHSGAHLKACMTNEGPAAVSQAVEADIIPAICEVATAWDFNVFHENENLTDEEKGWDRIPPPLEETFSGIFDLIYRYSVSRSVQRFLNSSCTKDPELDELMELAPDTLRLAWRYLHAQSIQESRRRAKYLRLRRRVCLNPECPSGKVIVQDIQRCRRCQIEHYCSRSCQTVHWIDVHHEVCHREPWTIDRPKSLTSLDKDFLSWQLFRECVRQKSELIQRTKDSELDSRTKSSAFVWKFDYTLVPVGIVVIPSKDFRGALIANKTDELAREQLRRQGGVLLYGLFCDTPGKPFHIFHSLRWPM
ncbi:hypothetical protein C8J56DRAFT_967844 [Mycena floridula]|nr:hypothetical protein C8J56DRAFT_967844 [Mycena floridula]